MLPINRYIFAKWYQGQFTNCVYFLHFCYVSAALMCLNESGGIEASINDAKPVLGPSVGGTAKGDTEMVMKIMSSILAIIATPILVLANARRTFWTFKNFKKQPDVHKLLPNMQRNT